MTDTKGPSAKKYQEPPRELGKHRFMAGTCVDCGRPLDMACTANLPIAADITKGPSAKERVLAVHPDAHWVYLSSRSPREFEIWGHGILVRTLGSGHTEDEAWEDAASRLPVAAESQPASGSSLSNLPPEQMTAHSGVAVGMPIVESEVELPPLDISDAASQAEKALPSLDVTEADMAITAEYLALLDKQNFVVMRDNMVRMAVHAYMDRLNCRERQLRAQILLNQQQAETIARLETALKDAPEFHEVDALQFRVNVAESALAAIIRNARLPKISKEMGTK